MNLTNLIATGNPRFHISFKADGGIDPDNCYVCMICHQERVTYLTKHLANVHGIGEAHPLDREDLTDFYGVVPRPEDSPSP